MIVKTRHGAENVADWCRTHDWGLNATATKDAFGKWQITGLLDVTIKNGTVSARAVVMPADPQALRDWAGY